MGFSSWPWVALDVRELNATLTVWRVGRFGGQNTPVRTGTRSHPHFNLPGHPGCWREDQPHPSKDDRSPLPPTNATAGKLYETATRVQDSAFICATKSVGHISTPDSCAASNISFQRLSGIEPRSRQPCTVLRGLRVARASAFKPPNFAMM